MGRSKRRRKRVGSFIRLSAVPDLSWLPPRIDGGGYHVSTVYRWAQRGIRGIRLKTVQVGGVKCTTREALLEFIFAITALSTHAEAQIPHPTRQRQVDVACERLDELLGTREGQQEPTGCNATLPSPRPTLSPQPDVPVKRFCPPKLHVDEKMGLVTINGESERFNRNNPFSAFAFTAHSPDLKTEYWRLANEVWGEAYDSHAEWAAAQNPSKRTMVNTFYFFGTLLRDAARRRHGQAERSPSQAQQLVAKAALFAGLAKCLRTDSQGTYVDLSRFVCGP